MPSGSNPFWRTGYSQRSLISEWVEKPTLRSGRNPPQDRCLLLPLRAYLQQTTTLSAHAMQRRRRIMVQRSIASQIPQEVPGAPLIQVEGVTRVIANRAQRTVILDDITFDIQDR